MDSSSKLNVKKVNKEKERDEWSHGLDFFLSALGYAVGVGNVWRFPYLCYKNGGGVFLIPYFVFMITIGIPMVYLEFTVGQFTSNAPLKSWKMIRIFKGIGISSNIANCLLVLFYNMIIAYSFYFLVISLTSELPWNECNPEWSSPNCVDDFSPDVFSYNACNDNSTLFKCQTKGSLNFGRCFNNTMIKGSNCDDFEQNTTIGFWKSSFPSQDYWTRVILNQSPSIDESGTLVWQLVLSLFCAYFMVYLMLIGGKKVSGKLVWFTALFPYLVLLILGIRGWLLPGAEIGIRYYIIPDWSRLADIQVWADAATQIFFTLSVGYGGMSTLSSYNKFNSNILRDAIIIPFANCLTSFFAGFVIFAYMGYLSKITGQDIGNIIQAGQGLAYVVYPYAVTTLVASPVWAVLFFIMMTLLGIDSTLGCVEVSLTSLFDAFPNLESSKRKRVLTVGIVFLAYFVCGLIFCLNSGAYWIEIFNTNAGSWAILIIGICECVVISYFYGMKNIRRDIKCMLGSKYTDNFTFYIWYALWGFISPVLMIVVTAVTLSNIAQQTLGDYTFPYWTLVLGQMMTASVLLGIFLWPIYAIIDAKYFKKRSIVSLFTPDFEAFIPKNEENRMKVLMERGISDKSISQEGLQNLGFETRF